MHALRLRSLGVAILLGTLLSTTLASAQDELSLADLIEKCEPSVVRLDVTLRDGRSIGSGFVVDRRGWVVTNHHVVAGAISAVATFNDDIKANVVGFLSADKKRDLVVLKIDTDRKLAALPLAAKQPRKGETTVALGSPSGLSFTATEGIVSAYREGSELKNFGLDAEGSWLQTSTPISPGSSGGPLLNRQGEVVGVNSGSLASAQNLNFAISSPDIILLVKSAATGKLTDLDKIEPKTIVVRSTPSTPSTSNTPSTATLTKPFRTALDAYAGASPFDEIRDKVVCKLPAKRDFDHRYKIEEAVDDFDKIKWIRTQWFPIQYRYPMVAGCGLQVTVAAKADSPMPLVVWQIATTSNRWAFFGSEKRRFQLIVGDDSVEFPNPAHKSDNVQGVTVEKLTSLFTLDDFLKMLKADDLRGRLGPMEYYVSPKEMECMRELISRLPTGTTSLTTDTPTPKLDGLPQNSAVSVIGLRRVAFEFVVEREDQGTDTATVTSSTTSEPAKPARDTEAEEKIAANRLLLAKNLLARGVNDRAKKYLEEILEKYPESESAKEAKKLLGTL